MGPQAPVLVDAGPLYAAADADDAHHHAALEVLGRLRGPLLAPILVIAEAAYLIGDRLGPEAELRFVGSLAAGEVVPEHVHAADWLRIGELVARYRDLPLGSTDASVVAAAERLGIDTIVTLDRRHFSVVRPRHVEAFTLLP